MAAMVIRDTQVDDAVFVAALIDSVSRARRFLAGTVGFPAESTREFIASVHSANGVHIVAELDGTLVGWCDIVRHRFEGMKHAGRLGMGVRLEFRGRGIGRALVEATRTNGNAQHCFGLELWTLNFERLGYGRQTSLGDSQHGADCAKELESDS